MRAKLLASARRPVARRRSAGKPRADLAQAAELTRCKYCPVYCRCAPYTIADSIEADCTAAH